MAAKSSGPVGGIDGEDAIGFVGPGDFISEDVPVPRSDMGDAAGFSQVSLYLFGVRDLVGGADEDDALLFLIVGGFALRVDPVDAAVFPADAVLEFVLLQFGDCFAIDAVDMVPLLRQQQIEEALVGEGGGLFRLIEETLHLGGIEDDIRLRIVEPQASFGGFEARRICSADRGGRRRLVARGHVIGRGLGGCWERAGQASGIKARTGLRSFEQSRAGSGKRRELRVVESDSTWARCWFAPEILVKI